MTKIDHTLFSAHEHALEQSVGVCPECGKPLHIKHSKNGPFVGCSGYPDCGFSKPLHDTNTTTLKTIAGTQCPLCDQALAIKKGRYGMFIGCTGFPECHFITQIKEQHETHVTCPQCNEGQLTERTNKYGKRFFSCNRYPACRYVLNSPPLERDCPECGWAVLIEKKGQYCCPQPGCGYHQPV